MKHNSMARMLSFSIVPLLFNFPEVLLSETPTVNSLNGPTLKQLRSIKYLSQFYLRELYFLKKDVNEGVLHWSFADFNNDLQILEQKWKDQKPTCFDSIDSSKEGLNKVVVEADTCLKQLEDTVQKVANLADQAKTLEEADNVVKTMLAYKTSRDDKIGECSNIATKMMPIYETEKKKIEECVKQ